MMHGSQGFAFKIVCVICVYGSHMHNTCDFVESVLSFQLYVGAGDKIRVTMLVPLSTEPSCRLGLIFKLCNSTGYTVHFHYTYE